MPAGQNLLGLLARSDPDAARSVRRRRAAQAATQQQQQQEQQEQQREQDASGGGNGAGRGNSTYAADHHDDNDPIARARRLPPLPRLSAADQEQFDNTAVDLATKAATFAANNNNNTGGGLGWAGLDQPEQVKAANGLRCTLDVWIFFLSPDSLTPLLVVVFPLLSLTHSLLYLT